MGLLHTGVDIRNIPQPKDETGLGVVLTQSLIFKLALSLGVMVIGIYYVLSGKRDQQVGKMVIGAVLIMAAFFLFF